MELLSPGGSIEKIETAFTYGADSVYFGLKDFSLRTNAKNVEYGTQDQLRDIKKRFGGKMYCTVNIYFHEDDIHCKMVNFTFCVFYHSNTERLEVQGEAAPT